MKIRALLLLALELWLSLGHLVTNRVVKSSVAFLHAPREQFSTTTTARQNVARRSEQKSRRTAITLYETIPSSNTDFQKKISKRWQAKKTGQGQRVAALANLQETISSSSWKARSATVILPSAGAVLATIVVYTLGGTLDDLTSRLETSMLGPCITQSPSDLITSSLGEATAALAATVSSFLTSIWISDTMENKNINSQQTDTKGTTLGPELLQTRSVASNTIQTTTTRLTTTAMGLNALDSNEIWKQQKLNFDFYQAQEKDVRKAERRRNLGRKAVTDGDFLVAQVASAPLLQLVQGGGGVTSSPLEIIVTSVFLAAIPAEAVNFAARQRMAKEEQNQHKVMEEEKRRLLKLELLLQEEESRKQKEKPFPLNLLSPRQLLLQEQAELAQSEDVVNSNSLGQVAADTNAHIRGIVLVDIITDLIKWLGYRILGTEYSGQLITMMYDVSTTTTANAGNGGDVTVWAQLIPLESAIFGVAAAFSAQLYADLFLAIFAFGGPAKQKEVQSRTLREWIIVYVQVALSAAVFFGVNEFVQIPAKAFIATILSGGAENCYGSQDYNLCVESYLFNNPPDLHPSPTAQLRALFTTFSSFWDRVLLEGL